MNELKLLGNGKLTVAARLSSLASAAVFGAVIVVAPIIFPKVIDYFENQRQALEKIVTWVEAQKERDSGQNHRLIQLEERATRIENWMLR